MTLDTHIYVYDEVVVGDVFDKARELLGCAPHAAADGNLHPWQDGDGYDPDGRRILQNRGGQGLPAWLQVHYRPSAPLCADGDACTQYCEPDANEHEHEPACFLRVDFDTGYSYRDDEGRGCGDLHACYVAALGQWLDGLGVSWAWQDEYTGEIHGGEDRYERLVDLMQGGHRAARWFESWVLPAVANHLAKP